MPIAIKCNCYTCEEYVDRCGDKICKAMTYLYSYLGDPAGHWLLKNKPELGSNAFVNENADNCPCWRCGSGLSIKPPSSIYQNPIF